MSKENLEYKNSMERLEAILTRIDNSEMEIDELAGSVQEATALLKKCRQILLETEKNVQEALGLIHTYDEKQYAAIQAEEDNIDLLTDRTTRYLADLSGHLTQQQHIDILNEYYKLVNEFERLGDYAVNIA
jgi:exodeoxyribonuclease VII small subunit